MITTLKSGPVAMPVDVVAAAPWELMPGLADVRHKLLWRAGDSTAGVMKVEAGHTIASHAHREAHHHAWVIEGTMRLLDTELAPGSYAHVPAGVDHEVVAGPEGCTFLYLYLEAHPA